MGWHTADFGLSRLCARTRWSTGFSQRCRKEELGWRLGLGCSGSWWLGGKGWQGEGNGWVDPMSWGDTVVPSTPYHGCPWTYSSCNALLTLVTLFLSSFLSPLTCFLQLFPPIYAPFSLCSYFRFRFFAVVGCAIGTVTSLISRPPPLHPHNYKRANPKHPASSATPVRNTDLPLRLHKLLSYHSLDKRPCLLISHHDHHRDHRLFPRSHR